MSSTEEDRIVVHSVSDARLSPDIIKQLCIQLFAEHDHGTATYYVNSDKSIRISWSTE